MGFVDASPIVTLPGRNCVPKKPVIDPQPGEKCDPRLNTTQCSNGRVCPEGANATTAFCVCPAGTQEIIGGYCLPNNPCQSPNVDCDARNAWCLPTLTGYTCLCKPGKKDLSLKQSEPGRVCITRKSTGALQIGSRLQYGSL